MEDEFLFLDIGYSKYRYTEDRKMDRIIDTDSWTDIQTDEFRVTGAARHKTQEMHLFLDRKRKFKFW